MRRTRADVAFVVALVLLVSSAGCSRGPGRLELDGSARPPDAEGVVTEVSARRLTLDGSETYEIDDELQCFSAATLAAVPLAARRGTYVHLGLDDRVVTWLAGYSAVVEFPGQPPLAYHTGVLVAIEDQRARFEDGSLLRVAAGIAAPPRGSRVTAAIDTRKKAVVQFMPAGGAVQPAAP